MNTATTNTVPATTPVAAVKSVKPAAKPLAKTPVQALRRGVKKAEVVELMAKFKFPTTPFTIKDAVIAFGIDHWYIVNYIKKNGKIVGDAPKTPGVRGKSAKLYLLPAK